MTERDLNMKLLLQFIEQTNFIGEHILFQDPYTVVRVRANTSQFPASDSKILLAKVSKKHDSSLSTLVCLIGHENPFLSSIVLAFGIDIVTIWIVTWSENNTFLSQFRTYH